MAMRQQNYILFAMLDRWLEDLMSNTRIDFELTANTWQPSVIWTSVESKKKIQLKDKMSMPFKTKSQTAESFTFQNSLQRIN